MRRGEPRLVVGPKKKRKERVGPKERRETQEGIFGLFLLKTFQTRLFLRFKHAMNSNKI